MSQRYSTIELHRQNMDFCAGHFTIFSETHREKLHGHNYSVHALITTVIEDNGLSFDYRFYKRKIIELCRSLHEIFIIPAKSRFLKIEEVDDMIFLYFHDEKVPFLKKDVIMLPIVNATVEELARYFVENLIADKDELAKNKVDALTIKISTCPGQSGSYTWEK